MSRRHALLLACALLGGCSAMPAEDIHLSKSILTANPPTDRFTRHDQQSFRSDETLHLITIVQWSETRISAGEHEVQWRWFRTPSDFIAVEQKMTLYATPFELYGEVPASALGPGPHRVEVYIDERRIETREFDVGP